MSLLPVFTDPQFLADPYPAYRQRHALGAANRDPRTLHDPEHFDIRREPDHHLAFGEGPQSCLGAALARLEGRLALETLLERLPQLALAPGAALSRQPNSILRGWSSLPVAFA